MTDLMKQVDERIALLEEELRKLKEFKALSSWVASALAGPVPSAQELRSQAEPTILGSASAGVESSRRARERLNPSSAEIIDKAINVLLRAKRPLNRREIFEAMKADGLEIKGADPVKALGTILWRHQDQIESTDEGYWPVGAVRIARTSDDMLASILGED